ncbi:hypothetical protein, partial [Klebsiella pneumoniae]|uniref:hypothetical protein n=1 Tax=Klebsiella pneumoniae TaxID=573 RepID=UPI0024DEDB9F
MLSNEVGGDSITAFRALAPHAVVLELHGTLLSSTNAPSLDGISAFLDAANCPNDETEKLVSFELLDNSSFNELCISGTTASDPCS